MSFEAGSTGGNENAAQKAALKFFNLPEGATPEEVVAAFEQKDEQFKSGGSSIFDVIPKGAEDYLAEIGYDAAKGEWVKPAQETGSEAAAEAVSDTERTALAQAVGLGFTASDEALQASYKDMVDRAAAWSFKNGDPRMNLSEEAEEAARKLGLADYKGKETRH